VTQQRRFSYRPVIGTHDGPCDEGFDERGHTVGFITDLRSSGDPHCWVISSRDDDGEIIQLTGEYAAAEDAVSVLEKRIIQLICAN